MVVNDIPRTTRYVYDADDRVIATRDTVGENDIVLSDPRISRHHVDIRIDESVPLYNSKSTSSRAVAALQKALDKESRELRNANAAMNARLGALMERKIRSSGFG